MVIAVIWMICDFDGSKCSKYGYGAVKVAEDAQKQTDWERTKEWVEKCRSGENAKPRRRRGRIPRDWMETQREESKRRMPSGKSDAARCDGM